MEMTANRLIVFDTTLRDGEQCPGASMTSRQKLEVAKQLARLGVDVIEAGFPVISQGDFESVSEIAAQVKGPKICGLARCLPKDIEAAAEALKAAADAARIHVFLATSQIHRRFKLAKDEEEIVRIAVEGVRLAKRYVQDVEFSAEDASRTEPEFLAKIIQKVIEAGATTVNIPDTVGYAVPEEFASLIRYLFDHVQDIDKVVVSVHCHNDLGLAVSNSLAAIKAGARQVEGTINGIGERAGNAALEEIIMALHTRPDAFGKIETGIQLKEILRTSRLVSRMSGLAVQRNKAVVGENAFAHAAGIHQDGILKKRETYEIIDPKIIGWEQSELPLTKHSGRAALENRLKILGFELEKEEIDNIFSQFKQIGDKKKFIYDDDLVSLVEGQISRIKETYELEYVAVTVCSGGIPMATIKLRHGEEVLVDASTGDGAVDAAMKAVDRITGQHGHLVEYEVKSVTEGKDAIGEVTVKVNFDSKKLVTAKAASTDVIEASIKAYLNAVNKALL
ncbi:Isopropylmalate synthase [Methylacidiphilum infernorum V4]|uniref:2-isopropylmalate synthase n=2 Tax=Candidatus Methylacidiphilum infernorum TaxID=511746 RepID=LEU1_METI4|nr:RecName: Full=2-isopropylmalate synthase; AltName: Full=Alpha-IPM synthase; AltName: Full=Alpha-isopropylmalate synthase [Methylacidiphilum infernorum V4]ACD83797.1 Isopropylmalate synthase [Methylacidiphilum infernorum V4]